MDDFIKYVMYDSIGCCVDIIIIDYNNDNQKKRDKKRKSILNSMSDGSLVMFIQKQEGNKIEIFRHHGDADKFISEFLNMNHERCICNYTIKTK